MKVEHKPKYTPITIVLENEDEFRVFKQLATCPGYYSRNSQNDEQLRDITSEVLYRLNRCFKLNNLF